MSPRASFSATRVLVALFVLQSTIQFHVTAGKGSISSKAQFHVTAGKGSKSPKAQFHVTAGKGSKSSKALTTIQFHVTAGKGSKSSKTSKGDPCIRFSQDFYPSGSYQIDPHEIAAIQTHCGGGSAAYDSVEDGSALPGATQSPTPAVPAATKKPVMPPSPSPTEPSTESPHDGGGLAPSGNEDGSKLPGSPQTPAPVEAFVTNEPSESPTGWPSSVPSSMPTIDSGCPGLSIQDRQKALRSAVKNVSGESSLDDSTSPQFQSYKWLETHDSLRLCPEDANLEQRYALALFYFATLGDEWLSCTRNGSTPCDGYPFLSGFHECLWGGITCGPGRRVLNINLDSNNLRGPIPEEIKVFDRLVEFDVDNNTLTGTITTSFKAMTSLRFLDLDNNLLTGTIPEEIYTLMSLAALDLDTNRLIGSISTNLGLLTDLFIVQFDLNQLTGVIPTEAGLLANLAHFTATGNNFTGPVPTELCGVPSEALVADCDICNVMETECCTNCTNP